MARLDPATATRQMSMAAPAVTSHFVAAMTATALIFAVIGTIAAAVPLQSTIAVSGVVAAEKPRVEIRSTNAGVIGTLHVRNGDVVTAGSPLVDTIDPRRREDRIRLHFLAAEQSAIKARIQAEISGTAFVAPDPGPIDAVAWRRTLDDQRRRLEERRRAFAEASAQSRHRIAHAGADVAGHETRTSGEHRRLAELTAELAELRKRPRPSRAVRARIATLEKQEPALADAVAQLNAAIEQHRGALRDLQAAWTEVEVRRSAELADALRAAEDDLATTTARLIAMPASLERSVIHAPVAGRIIGVAAIGTEESVRAGQTLMAIEAVSDEIVIEAHVAVGNLPEIRVGQAAKIQLLGFTRSLPPIGGELISIASEHQRDSRTGRVYYVARLRPGAPSKPMPSDAKLWPGMPVNVAMAVGKRTMFERVFAPLASSPSSP